MSIDPINDLIKVYSRALPPDVTSSAIGKAIATTISTVMAAVENQIAWLSLGIHLSTAAGAFLDQHAKDRGLRRQSGETDDQLRERLRKPPQAGTASAILEAVDAIIGSFGPTFMVELPRQSLYFDQEKFLDQNDYLGGGRGVVIVFIPASANALASVRDAVRSKVSAGKIWIVEEYTT